MGFDEFDGAALAMLLLSPVFLFLGSKLFKPTLGLLGVGLGGYFTWIGLKWIDESGKVGDISQNTMIFLTLSIGLLSGVLLIKVTRFGIFLLGFAGFLFLSNIVVNFIFSFISGYVELGKNAGIYNIVAVFLFSMVGGLLMLYFVEKFLVRLITSLIGGYMFVGGFSHFLQRWGAVDFAPLAPRNFFSRDPNDFACRGDYACWIMLVVWAILWIVGVVVQFKLFPQDDKKGEERSVSKDDDRGRGKGEHEEPRVVIIKQIIREPDFRKYRMGTRHGDDDMHEYRRGPIRRGKSRRIRKHHRNRGSSVM